MADKLYCLKCGKPLTDENTHPAQNANGVSAYCLDCEAKSFDNFAGQNGLHFALFLNCARFDVPCEPSIVPENFAEKGNTAQKWKDYIDALIKSPKYNEQMRSFEFDSGVNRFLRVFGKELSNKDFAGYMLAEQKLTEAKPGTQTQRDRWGEVKLWVDLPLTKEVYDDLDRRYASRMASYSGQTVTPQMEETVLKACRLDATLEHLLAKGESRPARDMQAILDNMLASEQMRKKDEKPVDAFRFDAWISAMEKSGYMLDRDFVGKEAMIEQITKAMRRKKYRQPLDVAHQIEMNIINHARKNSDQPLLTELPEDMVVTDEYGEFEPTESDEYKKALVDTNLAKIKVPTKKGKEKK